ncbi:MAG: GyrI-like domain-containing protein [Gammaproteobacteria bacterium]|nr:GyrI-like domain-containing protein [Gammaproteobacteria bacterium]
MTKSVRTEPVQLQDRAADAYAAIRVRLSLGELGPALAKLWPEVSAWLDERGIMPAGRPLIRYHVIDMPEMEISVGLPIESSAVGDGRIEVGELPAGRYAVLVHVGPYEDLVQANVDLQRWAADHGVAFDGGDSAPGWAGRVEFYLTDPMDDPDPLAWRTEVAYLTLPDSS